MLKIYKQITLMATAVYKNNGTKVGVEKSISRHSE